MCTVTTILAVRQEYGFTKSRMFLSFIVTNLQIVQHNPFRVTPLFLQYHIGRLVSRKRIYIIEFLI